VSEFLKHLVDRLVDAVPVLFIVDGILLFLGSVGGGVRYQSFFPIDDPVSRVACGIGGALVFAIGVYLWSSRKSAAPNAKAFGIKITQPKTGDIVAEFRGHNTDFFLTPTWAG
jgi:hypothetical protein